MKKLLKAKEVAELLGLSTMSIYQRARRKTIPFIKMGGALRFDEDEIAAWLKEQTIK